MVIAGISFSNMKYLGNSNTINADYKRSTLLARLQDKIVRWSTFIAQICNECKLLFKELQKGKQGSHQQAVNVFHFTKNGKSC